MLFYSKSTVRRMVAEEYPSWTPEQVEEKTLTIRRALNTCEQREKRSNARQRKLYHRLMSGL